jgi:hypothetical protein
MDNEPPSRQVQTVNPFSILGQLGDTVLEHDLDRWDRKSAYLPPNLQGYRVPRIPTVAAEEPKPKPKGKKGRGRRNRRNRQQWQYPVYTTGIQDKDESEAPGDTQPEVDIAADRSLFTRTTEPHNPRHIKEILKHVVVVALGARRQ